MAAMWLGIMRLIPNSDVPAWLEGTWTLACKPHVRISCCKAMMPNSLNLFGFDCAGILGSAVTEVQARRPNCGGAVGGVDFCNRMITLAK